MKKTVLYPLFLQFSQYFRFTIWDLIKESNELVSIFAAALKTSKAKYKSQIPNRKSEIFNLQSHQDPFFQ